MRHPRSLRVIDLPGLLQSSAYLGELFSFDGDIGFEDPEFGDHVLSISNDAIDGHERGPPVCGLAVLNSSV